MIEEASFQGEHKKIQFLFDILIFIYVLLIRKLERFRLVDDIVESYLDDEGYDSLNKYSSIYTFKVLYFFPLSIIGNKEYLFLYNIYRFSVLLFSLICVHISKQ